MNSFRWALLLLFTLPAVAQADINFRDREPSGQSSVTDSVSVTRTVLAGMALSLALAGLFFLRQPGRARTVAWVCLGIGILLGLTSLVIAASPPL